MKQPTARDLTDETEMTAQGADLDAPIPYRVAQFHGDARPVLNMLASIGEARRLLDAALTSGHLASHARADLVRMALNILNSVTE